MGTVYLARATDGASASTVAIKVLHPHLASDGDMVAMFLDEARIATRFRHANLVRVRDVDLVRDELSIVMDYVEGTTLGGLQSTFRQRGERLPLGLIVSVVRDALSGLHAMHELVDEHGATLGLVHRDVSPQNLLIGTDGVTRVADFGVALAAGRLASTRPDGTVKGKLQYLAPEQIGRKPLDRRVDVFAAGIVLWECLTGEPLFGAATEAETITRVLRDPVAPPSSSRPEVSTALDEACLHALERDPRRRFATAVDFAEALRDAGGEAWTADEVGALVAQTAAEPIRRQREALKRPGLAAAARSRRRIGMASGGAVVLAAALLGLRVLPIGRHASAAIAALETALPSPPSPVASAASPEPASSATAAPAPAAPMPAGAMATPMPAGAAAAPMPSEATPVSATDRAATSAGTSSKAQAPRVVGSATARANATKRAHQDAPAPNGDAGGVATPPKRPPPRPFMPNDL
jgi:serine/threonine-protein kinase